MNDADKLARTRFLLLNLVRIAGLVAVLIGIAIHYGRIAAPEPAAWILVAVGLVDFFFVPNLLARNWRTPDA
jgi:hypothetical protein